MYKEERDASEDIRRIDECDMDKFSTLDNNEKTIAILGDRWWPQKAKQEGDKISKKFLRNTWTNGNERPNVCLLYTSPSPRDRQKSRMPSSA